MPRLYGDRIMLREYRREDFEGIRQWVNDSDITEMLSDLFLYPHAEKQTEDFLNMMIEGKNIKGFIIADKETGVYMGSIDLIEIDWRSRHATLGIVIGKPDCRSKGYGTEAIRLLQDFVFNTLNLNKLQLTVHDFNIRGYKCYLKCGFKEEGRIRQNFFHKGKFTDTIHMGILKSEYESMNQNK